MLFSEYRSVIEEMLARGILIHEDYDGDSSDISDFDFCVTRYTAGRAVFADTYITVVDPDITITDDLEKAKHTALRVLPDVSDKAIRQYVWFSAKYHENDDNRIVRQIVCNSSTVKNTYTVKTVADIANADELRKLIVDTNNALYRIIEKIKAYILEYRIESL